MSVERYRGYVIEGFAKPDGNGEFASLGRVTKCRQIIKESDVLGLHEWSDRAQSQGISWARRYVDQLDGSHAA